VEKTFSGRWGWERVVSRSQAEDAVWHGFHYSLVTFYNPDLATMASFTVLTHVEQNVRGPEPGRGCSAESGTQGPWTPATNHLEILPSACAWDAGVADWYSREQWDLALGTLRVHKAAGWILTLTGCSQPPTLLSPPVFIYRMVLFAKQPGGRQCLFGIQDQLVKGFGIGLTLMKSSFTFPLVS
jgi:hypothetical protein